MRKTFTVIDPSGKPSGSHTFLCLASVRGLRHTYVGINHDWTIRVKFPVVASTEALRKEVWEAMSEVHEATGLPMPDSEQEGRMATLSWPADITTAHSLRSVAIVRQFLDDTDTMVMRLRSYRAARACGASVMAAFFLTICEFDHGGAISPWFVPARINGHTIFYGMACCQGMRNNRAMLVHTMLFDLQTVACLQPGLALDDYMLVTDQDDVRHAAEEAFDNLLPQQEPYCGTPGFGGDRRVHREHALAWTEVIVSAQRAALDAAIHTINTRKKAA